MIFCGKTNSFQKQKKNVKSLNVFMVHWRIYTLKKKYSLQDGISSIDMTIYTY